MQEQEEDAEKQRADSKCARNVIHNIITIKMQVAAQLEGSSRLERSALRKLAWSPSLAFQSQGSVFTTPSEGRCLLLAGSGERTHFCPSIVLTHRMARNKTP